jgi:ribosomal protein L29
MATHVSPGELRAMQLSELLRECISQRAIVAKMRLGIQQKKEKDTARYRRERRTLAQMETVLTEKNRAPSARVASSVPAAKAPAKKSSAKKS